MKKALLISSCVILFPLLLVIFPVIFPEEWRKFSR